MAEEEVKEEEQEQEEEQDNEVQGSTVEALAIKLGWNPDHEGGDREFVSAEDFILRSKEIQSTQTKQNKSLKRELGDLKRSMNELKNHNDTVYKVQVKALKSKVAELQGRRSEAVEDGDSKAVTQIDAQIRDINEIPDELPVSTVVEPSQEFVEWEEQNPWYNEDPKMRLYADTIGKEYGAKNLPLDKVFELVTKDVKATFPEKFPEKKKEKPRPVAAAVEGASVKNRGETKSKYKYSDLSRKQQDICDDFVKRGIMTRDQYIKDLEIIAENQGRA